MTNWIRFEEQHPIDMQKVLIWDDIGGYVDLCIYRAEFNSFQEYDEYGDFVDGGAEYWMPLPAKPENS